MRSKSRSFDGDDGHSLRGDQRIRNQSGLSMGAREREVKRAQLNRERSMKRIFSEQKNEGETDGAPQTVKSELGRGYEGTVKM